MIHGHPAQESSSEQDEPEPCPYEGRRLPRELYIKFFVVNFVAIGNYGHLNHLRREPRNIASYVLMFISPIAGAALIVVPVVALMLQAIIRRRDWWHLGLSLGVLIGQLPRNNEVPGVAPRTVFPKWPPKLSLKLTGRILAMLALMAQSVGSIVLVVRRVQHRSDALYDWRILQLAILGLSVSILSIVHLILEPRHPNPLGEASVLPPTVDWLLCLRPVNHDHLKVFRTLVDWINANLALLAGCVMSTEYFPAFPLT